MPALDPELLDALLAASPEELGHVVQDMPLDAVSALLEELGVEPASMPETPLLQAMELDESYRERPHLAYASQRIAQAVRDVEAGRSRRLIIEMPPRMGKTYLATQISSLWLLRRHANWNIALTSHDGNLAAQWGRQVRRWVEQGKAAGVEVARDAGAVKEWETVSGGGVLSRSIRESFTGRGAKVLVIDDPHKDFADAHSATGRESVWNWWLSVAQTRLEPPSLVIVIMCMTGDTPVLRPDGSETPLRDIRPGDEIATYENGGLTTSRVMNWANQGPDDVFSIRLGSGRVVRANARHPFLTVDENGVETWQRTDQLRQGSSILTVTGASGEVLSVKSQDAPSRSVARESAGRTTTSVAGLRVTDLPQLTPTPEELRGSSTATASPRRNTMRWSTDSEDSAQSAESHRQTGLPIGAASSASTTITSPVESESFSATTATSLSSDTSRLNDSEPPLSTWNVTPDRVVSIEPAGREDVFDLQVERTENFIANGLVSHNTRWHEDDLVGRLLSDEHEGDPAEWERIQFPALATSNDQLEREAGSPLLSPLFEETSEEAAARWAETRTSVGEYVWSALMQQQPAPAKGAIFDADSWRYWTDDAALAAKGDKNVVYLNPAADLTGARWLDSWDMAFKGTATSDYVVGQRWARQGPNRYLIDQTRGRLTFTQTLERVKSWLTSGIEPQRVHQRLVEDKANGTAILDTLKAKVSGFKPVNPRDGKEARARAVTPEIESGHVYLPHPSMQGYGWVRDLLSELRNFPHDAHDDQVDALTQALAELRESGRGSVGSAARRGARIERGYAGGRTRR